MQDGLYAKLNTSKGAILVSLEYKKTPGTVGNFVALAEGQMENAAKPQGKPYYDGLTFHRVIPNFMIQGGCPLGTGTGNPGYQFDDEFHADLKHDGPGVLSMANAGPGTNGSQFFITHIETPWLDGAHTVFGKVQEGQDVVDSIEQGERRLEEERKARQAELDKLAAGFEQTKSGLRYKIIQKGDGAQPQKGQTVKVHYKGQLADGTVFDSSYKRNQPLEFNVGVGQVIAGWDEGIGLLNVGDKARLVIPSDLGYGSRGAGGVIPPNATLIFDVELMDVK